ncbi:uncharacterized protein [Watersipora subatra]|uniref:uncharacterized protein n=1 Tax=Watersipora subatra TaxID=2589382 RepID=UPI00355BBABC
MNSLKPPDNLDFVNSFTAWPEWLRRFNRYRSASGLDMQPPERQINTLIYIMGEEAEKIETQITVRPPRAAAGDIAEEDEAATRYDRTVECFRNYFNPRSNHLHHAVLFGSQVQQSGETSELFICTLHDMASKCEWEDRHRSEMLKMRLLVSMQDKSLSRELQLDPDVTLDTIKQKIRAKEIIMNNQKAEIDGAVASSSNHVAVAAINKDGRRPRYSAGNQSSVTSSNFAAKSNPSNNFIRECKFCGGSHAKGRCWAYGKSCRKCQWVGHFARKCPSIIHAVSQVAQEYEEDDQIFSVANIENNVDSIGHSKVSNLNKWIIDISICGHSLQAKVDTGAEVSVMTKRVFLSLGFDKVRKSQASLSGFVGHRMNVIGRRRLTIVLHDGRKVSTMFYINDGESDMVTLIGMPAIRERGLISEISEVKMPNSKSSLEVVAELSKVFQGLGKLKQEVNLELKISAVARAAAPRKVLRGVRDKLKKELTKLETQRVIARDTESSQWLNPIVIVNKPSRDIRICLDPQYSNTQLVRSHCHELSAEGLHISKSKVEAVIQMVTPEDKKAVERFLGFINYLAKFVPQISEHTHSLRQVCRKGSEFFWEEPQAEAFAKIKQLIQQAPVLAYFEESRPVVLSADSSSHSIGAVLTQDGRSVEFAAKSLTECQQRYSQIEKEFLALMFACKRFKYYCWGRGKVTVETDQ